MSVPYSRDALLKFIDALGEKGLANSNTAQSLRVSCGKILADLSAAEEADVRTIDVDLAVRKFANKNPGKLAPKSLAEYQRRVEVAIREFVLHQGDPAGYKGLGRSPAKAENGEKSPSKKKEPTAKATPRPNIEHTVQPVPTSTTGLSHYFPLREDFLAQLVLPRDLKTSEALRLGAFIRALASDFAPPE